MTTSSEISVTAPVNDTQIKTPASLYAAKTELESLKDDLKYVTGAKNKAEVEAKIVSLESNISDLAESKIIEKSIKDNFDIGMSFTQDQAHAIGSLNNFLKSGNGKSDRESAQIPNFIKDKYTSELYGDLELKKDFDNFVKAYRTNRNSLSVHLDDNRYSELDKLVLDYEKSFGINAGPLVNEDQKVKRKAEYQRQEDIRFVKERKDYLTVLENKLLEEKASAKISILGRKDTSKTDLTEKEIAKTKAEMALGVTMAASKYLGFNVDQSDLGL